MKHPTVFMTDANPTKALLPLQLLLLLLMSVFTISVGCDQLGLTSNPEEKAKSSVQRSSFQTRADRRAYDGAPPVVAHQSFGVDCNKCHTAEGKVIPTVGLAPANPHLGDPRAGSLINCRQCHVFAETVELFVQSDFDGLRQQYKPAERAHKLAPPVIPHPTNMRANCLACHSGQSARREILCTHPERTNCVQCHVESSTPASVEMLGVLAN